MDFVVILSLAMWSGLLNRVGSLLGLMYIYVYCREVSGLTSLVLPASETVAGSCMLRIKLLRNLLLLSLAIAILLPLYQHFLVHPSYNKLLIEKTEDEAVRYASYMARTLGLEGRKLTEEQLPENLGERLKPVSRDAHLLKLRIFSASGEIIFSTKADEIGQVNEKTYFTELVANGRVFSKVAQKDGVTAEGVSTKVDIVETYVPFMTGESFNGAFEVYYDVTESFAKEHRVSQHSMVIILLMTAGFLAAVCFALYRAYISFQERAAAEIALQAANEDLERRISERTEELSLANEQLTDQIAEKAHAQIALSDVLEEIEADREKLDGILSSVPDGVVVMDANLNVMHMNAAAEMILGCSLEASKGQSVGSLSSEVDFVKKLGQRINNIHGSPSFDFELSTDGALAPRIYSVRISQRISESLESSGVVMLIRDVTRERDIERMKNAFLGMATHELNTPLTTIIGYTELLTAAETSENFSEQQQKDYLTLIHDKALSLAGLIDDLLDISRIASGRELAINYDNFCIGALIRNVVAEIDISDETHQLDMKLPDTSAMIYADQVRIGQVVEHLLSNALKYSPEGGLIRVLLTDDGEKYDLHVEDEGIGMNKEQLEHIFDRFYRADSSDTAIQGVGLGMSIVRHVVLAHHGDIQVDSQLGKGTKVLVSLPKQPPSSQEITSQPFSS